MAAVEAELLHILARDVFFIIHITTPSIEAIS